MNPPDQTVARLRDAYVGTPFGASLEYVLAQDHASRLVALQSAVDFACNQLEQHKHKKQGADKKGLSEDEITLQICEMLNSGGFQAAHDDDTGGHCDIVVKGRDLFLWLAEAKKHDGYHWLDKGFQQLSTRYSTGTIGQDHGEVLVYCYTKDAKNMLSKWREELQARNVNLKTTDSSTGNALMFHSTHKHASSGLDFHVRHKAIALYWDPKDK
ncbi:hypothetical protein [Mesorhizobium sp. NZP2077]|uniref:hypothetical protein n=1 Tax=Mesorhizobium sp. NZP2077 TaxID=2483404 RepID=UPI001554D367|nr:hypothetical protein [Mesorhizobium sp. NZP2077]QKC83505.1 hypothetical protein EB232_19530 [Mesorhizobium sp. NZP2077]QKD17021.1 hypothetical protein HGP13_19275 [Mesorhizobium sp. NZP2077]